MLTTITAECSAPARSSSPTDWCLLRKRAHHLNTLERDKVSFLNTANRRQWISAPETPSVIRNLYLCVAPAERQRPLFILHVNNDVISDVTREHNVSKIQLFAWKYLLSWNLLNVPRTCCTRRARLWNMRHEWQGWHSARHVISEKNRVLCKNW